MVEIAEIFRQHGAQYREKFGDNMLPSHRQMMRAIEQCRTAALGHVYTCEECGETEYLYHSCRNRHCPKCQNGKAQQWLEKQRDMLLSVRYFLLTFTLPSELRDVTRSHQRLAYDLLFHTSAAAIQHLAGDPRFVGGQMGMVGVLHTWVVHCQPVGSGLTALKYLAPYIFRAEEFIRRFLQHVLPKGFVKVRYYGFLSSGLRQRLAALRQQIDCPPAEQPPSSEVADTDAQTVDSQTDVPLSNQVVRCPSCGRVMQRRPILRPQGRCPP